MRMVTRTLAFVLIFGALGAAASSWFTPVAEVDLDEQDAIDTALAALDAAGLEGTVTKPVVRSGHVTNEGEPVGVFVVFADVAEDQVEIRVLTDAGQLAYVDDRIGPGGSERLLTDEQFAAMDGYDAELGRDEWLARNAAASVAAVMIAGVGFVIATRSDPLWKE